MGYKRDTKESQSKRRQFIMGVNDFKTRTFHSIQKPDSWQRSGSLITEPVGAHRSAECVNGIRKPLSPNDERTPYCLQQSFTNQYVESYIKKALRMNSKTTNGKICSPLQIFWGPSLEIQAFLNQALQPFTRQRVWLQPKQLAVEPTYLFKPVQILRLLSTWQGISEKLDLISCVMPRVNQSLMVNFLNAKAS